jgi:hypothetical protein
VKSNPLALITEDVRCFRRGVGVGYNWNFCWSLIDLYSHMLFALALIFASSLVSLHTFSRFLSDLAINKYLLI